MKTFFGVNDDFLIATIRQASRRVVLVCPGIYLPVAEILCECFDKNEKLDVTVVIDPSDEVCRTGYGEFSALELLQKKAMETNLCLRSQEGVRIGILLADDKTLVWSPTPRSIESVPGEIKHENELFEDVNEIANGVFIGDEPSSQIAKAVAAEGEDVDFLDAEIGLSVVNQKDIEKVKEALIKNPVIPVDLQRITRVYSTNLQFVELKVRNAKISQSQFSISNELLNADVKDELKGLIDSRFKAFADLRSESVKVPAFINGEQAFDQQNKVIEVDITEAGLERIRNDIEKRFMYDIAGFGRLIAKEDRTEFQRYINAYEIQLHAYSKRIKELMETQRKAIISEACSLIQQRLVAANKDQMDIATLESLIEKGMKRALEDEPIVGLVFKDITYEQTQNADFLARVNKVLPAQKRKKLGAIAEHYQAAMARPTVSAPH